VVPLLMEGARGHPHATVRQMCDDMIVTPLPALIALSTCCRWQVYVVGGVLPEHSSVVTCLFVCLALSSICYYGF
jgi:hypothetical protein